VARQLAYVLLAVALVSCSGETTHHTPSPAPRITVSPQHGQPPRQVLDALYMARLDEQLMVVHTKANDFLLKAGARAVCAGWKAGLDYPRVVNTLPPWHGWQPWQEGWLVYSATTVYCPRFNDRLPVR